MSDKKPTNAPTVSEMTLYVLLVCAIIWGGITKLRYNNLIVRLDSMDKAVARAVDRQEQVNSMFIQTLQMLNQSAVDKARKEGVK